jgi:O-antigen/teichoic acid export membrane protein
VLSGIVFLFSFFITNKNEGALSFPERKEVKQILKYSLTALAGNLIFFLVYRVDYLFVKSKSCLHRCRSWQLYTGFKAGANDANRCAKLVPALCFPRTASGIERERLSNSITIMARIFSQLFLLVFIAIAFLGHYIFMYVLRRNFYKMQLPMLIIIPGIFSLSVLTLLSAFFQALAS